MKQKEQNQYGLFMVVLTSTLSTCMGKYEGNWTIDNNIRVESFGPYVVVSALRDNEAAYEVFIDLVEEWQRIEPGFREAIQEGMHIPELFFELGKLWQITRDYEPSQEVTWQKICPYLRKPRGASVYSGQETVCE